MNQIVDEEFIVIFGNGMEHAELGVSEREIFHVIDLTEALHSAEV